MLYTSSQCLCPHRKWVDYFYKYMQHVNNVSTPKVGCKHNYKHSGWCIWMVLALKATSWLGSEDWLLPSASTEAALLKTTAFISYRSNQNNVFLIAINISRWLKCILRQGAFQMRICTTYKKKQTKKRRTNYFSPLFLKIMRKMTLVSSQGQSHGKHGVCTCIIWHRVVMGASCLEERM